MKYSRLVAAATLSSVLILAACSDSEDAADTTTADAATATSDAGTETSDTADATSDAAGSTADAAAETQAPAEQAAYSIEEADALTVQYLSRAVRSEITDGDRARLNITRAYRGPARQAAFTADVLEPVVGQPERRDLQEDPVEPTVLAISREDGESPSAILSQTVDEDGLPSLHLLTEPEDLEPRIVWSAPMLPGTEVGTFDRRSIGSPVLRDGDEGDLVATPQEALTELAAYIDYPASGAPDVRTNGYAPLVRENASEQASAVSAQAEFSETNEVVEDATTTIIQEDGSAVVFGVLERESVFDVRSGMELIAPDVFAELSGESSITDSATLTTYVFVAMHIPADDGAPEMIAAREQVVSASGS